MQSKGCSLGLSDSSERGEGKGQRGRKAQLERRKEGKEGAQSIAGDCVGQSEGWPFLPVIHFLISFSITILIRYLNTTKCTFKVYNSGGFSIFIEICNCHHCLIPEYFYRPQSNDLLLAVTSHSFLLPVPGNHTSALFVEKTYSALFCCYSVQVLYLFC